MYIWPCALYYLQCLCLKTIRSLKTNHISKIHPARWREEEWTYCTLCTVTHQVWSFHCHNPWNFWLSSFIWSPQNGWMQTIKICWIFHFVALCRLLDIVHHTTNSQQLPSYNNHQAELLMNHKLHTNHSWAKSFSTHPLQNYILHITPFKPLKFLIFANYSPSNHPGLIVHHNLSLSRPPVSSMKFCNRS